MNEVYKVPLVDVLTAQLGEQVVMSGSSYVLLSDKSEVPPSDVAIAEVEALKNNSDAVMAEVVAKAKQYLSDTDWYYTRLAETGEVVPANVVEARVKARADINGELV